MKTKCWFHLFYLAWYKLQQILNWLQFLKMNHSQRKTVSVKKQKHVCLCLNYFFSPEHDMSVYIKQESFHTAISVCLHFSFKICFHRRCSSPLAPEVISLVCVCVCTRMQYTTPHEMTYVHLLEWEEM